MKIILLLCFFVMSAHAQRPTGTKSAHNFFHRELHKLEQDLIKKFTANYKKCLRTSPPADLNLKTLPNVITSIMSKETLEKFGDSLPFVCESEELNCILTKDVKVLMHHIAYHLEPYDYLLHEHKLDRNKGQELLKFYERLVKNMRDAPLRPDPKPGLGEP